jgi:hypothetical protein
MRKIRAFRIEKPADLGEGACGDPEQQVGCSLFIRLGGKRARCRFTRLGSGCSDAILGVQCYMIRRRNTVDGYGIHGTDPCGLALLGRGCRCELLADRLA